MVQNCIVRGCGSKWCPGGDIRFHPFPKNSTHRKSWLSIVPLKNKFYESARICNLHFQESDYYKKTRRLKETAVPNIIDQETVPPAMIISSMHEDYMVKIDPLAVPSTSSDISDRNFPLMEIAVKRAGGNIEEPTDKKQCRKVLENISNLNELPVSFPFPYKILNTHLHNIILCIDSITESIYCNDLHDTKIVKQIANSFFNMRIRAHLKRHTENILSDLRGKRQKLHRAMIFSHV